MKKRRNGGKKWHRITILIAETVMKTAADRIIMDRTATGRILLKINLPTSLPIRRLMHLDRTIRVLTIMAVNTSTQAQKTA